MFIKKEENALKRLKIRNKLNPGF